jgi:hypothetical protein
MGVLGFERSTNGGRRKGHGAQKFAVLSPEPAAFPPMRGAPLRFPVFRGCLITAMMKMKTQSLTSNKTSAASKCCTSLRPLFPAPIMFR